MRDCPEAKRIALTYLAELEKSTDDQEIAKDLVGPITDGNSGSETEAHEEAANEAIELKLSSKTFSKLLRQSFILLSTQELKSLW